MTQLAEAAPKFGHKVAWFETTFILERDGQQTEVTVKTQPTGFIFWCSHWELIEDLKAMGVVYATKGPLHHRDYYLIEG